MQKRVGDNEVLVERKQAEGLTQTNRAHNLYYNLCEVFLAMKMLVVVWVRKDTKGTKLSDEHTAFVFSYP
jgi:hypothetical protein